MMEQDEIDRFGTMIRRAAGLPVRRPGVQFVCEVPAGSKFVRCAGRLALVTPDGVFEVTVDGLKPVMAGNEGQR